MIELEVKFRLDDSVEFELQLQRKGYKKVETLIQVDTYFNSPFHQFEETDEALRIREMADKIEFTYKGPKTSQKSKMREEISVAIESASYLTTILNRLGFNQVAQVKKNREVYRKAGSPEITIDKVDQLGVFTEFELVLEDGDKKDEQEDHLRNICKQFGLDPDKQIRTSYLELLLAKDETQ